jgi:hypothetical protein
MAIFQIVYKTGFFSERKTLLIEATNRKNALTIFNTFNLPGYVKSINKMEIII